VDAVYRVLEGEVCLTRFSPEGAEFVLYRARKGEFFAEASLFASHYHCDAICTYPGRCLRLPADALPWPKRSGKACCNGRDRR